MKTLMFVISVVGFVSVSAAQGLPQDQVPSLVLNAFQSKYTNATDVEWELKDGHYQAEFEVNTRDHDLWIDKDGVIKKHIEDFSKAELPSAIREKIENEFKEYRVDDVGRIETDGKVTFLVDLDGKSDDREVLFSTDGTIQENRID